MAIAFGLLKHVQCQNLIEALPAERVITGSHLHRRANETDQIPSCVLTNDESKTNPASGSGGEATFIMDTLNSAVMADQIYFEGSGEDGQGMEKRSMPDEIDFAVQDLKEEFHAEQLQIHDVIAEGGFGTVYTGVDSD